MAGHTTDEIIVTFGEKAAFGSITRPGGRPLRLLMDGGVSWLVEADPVALAHIDNPAARPTDPDYMIPPAMGAAAGLAAGGRAAPGMAQATAGAANTVDVVLGYTPGFASYHGGASQALTRLNYLVDVTNQAYANSLVDARLRLVHAMQVDYPDATQNDTWKR